jgi:hypothetical protein
MRWRVATFCFCLLLAHSMAKSSLAQSDPGSPVWQASVKIDTAVLYSGVSESSRVVTQLSRGDAVLINMESPNGRDVVFRHNCRTNSDLRVSERKSA